MDHIAETLHTQYFGRNRTAATLVKPGASVEDYIEAGLKATLQTTVNMLRAAYSPETITFNDAIAAGRMKAAIEGSIGWLPDPTQRGYLGVFLGPDQFDLSKAELYVVMDLPNGKKFSKAYNLGRMWLDKPTRMNGKQFAARLKLDLDAFFLSAENV